MIHTRLHALGRALATLWCVLGVPIFVIALVWTCFDVPISSFRPFLNDEVAYWHQVATFSVAGLHGGYYTLGELTNPSGFTPFGHHGPGFAIAYGLIGAVLGWHRHSIVVLNLVAIGLASWWFVTLATLSIPRMLLCGALLVTFWPLVLWAPTGMQEGLHYAGAVAMAAFFAHALKPERSRLVEAAGWVLLAMLAFVRPSWLVLMPLWAFATSRMRPPRVQFASIALSMLLSAGLFAAYNRSTAPYPSGFFFLQALTFDAGLRAILENLVVNLARAFAFHEYEPLEVWHRVEYWSWLGAGAVGGVVVAARERILGEHGSLHVLLGVVAAATALLLMLVLYTLTNWAEYRVLSAFLLFGVMLCVAAPGRAGPVLAAALVMTNLTATRTFVESFIDERHDNYVWDVRGLRGFDEAIQGHVVYRADRSRWCNTLLTAQYPPYLVAVPAGVGLSVVREADQLVLPPQSHYLLLDDTALAEIQRPVRVEELGRFPFGTLYRNLESGCE